MDLAGQWLGIWSADLDLTTYLFGRTIINIPYHGSLENSDVVLSFHVLQYRNGHFMALETEGGYLHFKFRVGRGIADIKGPQINDNNWHKVKLER